MFMFYSSREPELILHSYLLLGCLLKDKIIQNFFVLFYVKVTQVAERAL
jgi:hypothetical protein